MEAGSRSPVASNEAAASEALALWYEAWNAHDADAVSALMTEDVSYEDPAAPSPILHGRAAVEQYVGSAFAGLPDLHLEKLEEWVTPGGEVISSYFRFSATFAAELTAPGLPALAPTGSSRDARHGPQRDSRWASRAASDLLGHR